jgi:hypothetical protein
MLCCVLQVDDLVKHCKIEIQEVKISAYKKADGSDGQKAYLSKYSTICLAEDDQLTKVMKAGHILDLF